ncbi:hypothetical protein ACFVT8_07735 [Lysinibacillus sp. NPDC058147]|uniref:hypothetical protein n=1 Tax=unclassified Lysinibacillus TaxID=2636778 RepID=UPI0036DA7341
MKKFIFIMLLATLVIAVAYPTKSEAKVMYDGAEVVKGQTGKMTFKKDIKVYKKNPDGTFDSLVVKRNNFFRTYDIEKYDGKTFYQMGQYRVQATDLVVFKEVPIDIRTSIYNNPVYVMINHQGVKIPYQYQDIAYGQPLIVGKREEVCTGPKSSLVSMEKGKLNYHYCAGDIEGGPVIKTAIIDGTDVRIFEKINKGSYVLTEDTELLSAPMKGAPSYTRMVKGTIFQLSGIEIDGYVEVGLDRYYFNYIPANLLKPVNGK